jgi:hypothetical protein
MVVSYLLAASALHCETANTREKTAKNRRLNKKSLLQRRDPVVELV